MAFLIIDTLARMQQQNKAMLYGLAAVLCWSTVVTAFKLSLRFLSPIQLMLVASITAALCFALLLLQQGRLSQLFTQSPKVYLQSLAFTLLNPLCYYLCLLFAYQQLPAQEAQAINYSWAIVMSLLAVPLLGQELAKQDIIAAILCYSGILIIATKGNFAELEFANLSGVLLAVASTLIWSFYWIYNKRDSREPILGLCLNFLFSIPLIVLLWLILSEPLQMPFKGILGETILSTSIIALLLIIAGLLIQQTERDDNK